jgi:aminoglycoside 2'-N-acetyltransferase I
MTEIRVAHTADLDAPTLEQARSLLFEVFTGDDAMTDEDWEHCVGGMHALPTTTASWWGTRAW